MDLGKTLQYSGYALLPVAILLAIISGEYIFAFVLFFFLVMSAFSSRILPTKIPEGKIPDPAVIKQYRIDHPGTSIQDAMDALMTKPDNKA